MELSPSWEAASSSATQYFSNILWNRIGSLPCSLEPSNGPYPEPDQSSLYHPHPISLLKHPQSLFFPWCQRPQAGRQKVLNWMAASITRIQSAFNFLINQIWICYVVPKYLNSVRFSRAMLVIFILLDYTVSEPRRPQYEHITKTWIGFSFNIFADKNTKLTVSELHSP
jgi:hypothetical protein